MGRAGPVLSFPRFELGERQGGAAGEVSARRGRGDGAVGLCGSEGSGVGEDVAGEEQQ